MNSKYGISKTPAPLLALANFLIVIPISATKIRSQIEANPNARRLKNQIGHKHAKINCNQNQPPILSPFFELFAKYSATPIIASTANHMIISAFNDNAKSGVIISFHIPLAPLAMISETAPINSTIKTEKNIFLRLIALNISIPLCPIFMRRILKICPV